jgi:hypothetical protein
MDRSIRRPTGLQGSPRGSPPHRDTTVFGPIPDAADAGPRRSRIEVSRFRWRSRRRIALLLLALIVLPLLPFAGQPRDGTPARARNR